MGVIFIIPAAIIFVITSLWSLSICLGIVIDNMGFIGGLIAFFLLPLTLVFAPWYAAIADSNWFPLLLTYGCHMGASILYGIGAIIDVD